MLILPGSNALSPFRTQGLLVRLQALDPSIVAVTGRFTHFIDSQAALGADDINRLSAMLTYGDAFEENNASDSDADLFVVTPRFGTISPWASKATDIAHNCGMSQIKRIERGISYRVRRKSGLVAGLVSSLTGQHKKNSSELSQQIAGLLHDRMTEIVLHSEVEASGLFQELSAQPLAFVDILSGGAGALQQANKDLGLALS